MLKFWVSDYLIIPESKTTFKLLIICLFSIIVNLNCNYTISSDAKNKFAVVYKIVRLLLICSRNQLKLKKIKFVINKTKSFQRFADELNWTRMLIHNIKALDLLVFLVDGWYFWKNFQYFWLYSCFIKNFHVLIKTDVRSS